MSKLLDFEAIQKWLLNDEHVRLKIISEFKGDAPLIFESIAKGEEPYLPNVDVESYLLNLLLNDARLYKRLTARGAYGSYHIDIRGLGGVYFYWAPEFGTTGYFLSVESASAAIEEDWADNLISNTGRIYRKSFVIEIEK